METVYEGTWAEIEAYKSELGSRRLRVTVVEVFDTPAVRERLVRLQRSLAMVDELGEELPPFPVRTLTIDDYYPDDEERA